jgi:Uma2 family endonuclease
MAKPAYRVKYTYDDYLLFPEDGLRHELIGGEHYVTPAPTRKHQIAAGNLYRLLSVFVYEGKLGRVFFAPFDVILSTEDVVEPDLLYISKERSSIEEERGAFGAPDLVIEILSDSTRNRDETLKHSLYQAAGVLEYWLVDPDAETVRVERLGDGAYQLAAELSAGDVLETPLLPGFSVPVSRAFE